MLEHSFLEVPREIPRGGSFFDVGNYEQDLSRISADQRNVLFPVVLHGKMTRTSPPLNQEGAQSIRLDIAGKRFDWLGNLNASIWESLPVRSYHLVEQTDYRREYLVKELNHLADRHPDSFAILRTFVRVIGWMAKTPESETRIASASVPTLPFTIFVSDLAVRDLPPKTVTQQPSYRLLAENLLHESTHQRINFHLLENDVLVEGYDSASAPKIEIAWRKGREQAEWEVDRVLHATIVYNEILRYRLRELQDGTGEPFEREAFLESTAAGIGALSYLSDSLLGFERFFTRYGVSLVHGIASQTAAIAEEWKVSRVSIQ